MLTIFGWTYDQYVYAVNTLRIRPEELSESCEEALLDIQRIWVKSPLGACIDPPTDICWQYMDRWFLDVVDKVWMGACMEIQEVL